MQAEEKKRAKAIKAATKVNKPLFGEDGKSRAMLDKYDEEQEDGGMVLDDDGRAREERRREEIRAKLAQGKNSLCLLVICRSRLCNLCHDLCKFGLYRVRVFAKNVARHDSCSQDILRNASAYLSCFYSGQFVTFSRNWDCVTKWCSVVYAYVMLGLHLG